MVATDTQNGAQNGRFSWHMGGRQGSGVVVVVVIDLRVSCTWRIILGIKIRWWG